MASDCESDKRYLLFLTHQAKRAAACGEKSRAADVCTRALQLAEQQGEPLAELRILRSGCRRDLGDITGALEDIKAVIVSDPQNHEAYYSLAETYFVEMEFEQAFMYFFRCLELRPDVKAYGKAVRRAEDAVRQSTDFSTNDIRTLLHLLEAGIIVEPRACYKTQESPLFKKWQIPRQRRPEHEGSTPNSAHLFAPKPMIHMTPQRTKSTGPFTSKTHPHPIGSPQITPHVGTRSLSTRPSSKKKTVTITTSTTRSKSAPKSDLAFLRSLKGLPGITSHVEEGIQMLEQRKEFWRQYSPKHIGASPQISRSISAGRSPHDTAGELTTSRHIVTTAIPGSSRILLENPIGELHRPHVSNAIEGVISPTSCTTRQSTTPKASPRPLERRKGDVADLPTVLQNKRTCQASTGTSIMRAPSLSKEVQPPTTRATFRRRVRPSTTQRGVDVPPSIALPTTIQRTSSSGRVASRPRR
ncbi:Tetratricopeptide repeat-containing protein [Giardia muris]|uniref:Outer dynein arm-docking complex subunit 4 n=1 Tax=Giardia muris TaxID=5742 RepID=A0A4Z1SQW1_GIAMU|nr:Tetratricopeptide repeat-containing protein [Giardia muris]|eukprot:TNJ28264.1 Tetratricopeptide repeat-containing protein [Giardia muris]